MADRTDLQITYLRGDLDKAEDQIRQLQSEVQLLRTQVRDYKRDAAQALDALRDDLRLELDELRAAVSA